MAPAVDTEPARRAIEIEEPTNRYLIHPVSGFLVARFVRLGITPNMVSMMGMACGLLAGVAYEHYRDWHWALAGFALMFGWHVMDGADGQLARLTRAQSELGKVLDGICDYVTFAAVYVGLAVGLAREDGGWVWWLVAVAGMCHAVQAAAYEVQRQDYSFWGLDRKSAALPDLDAIGPGGGGLRITDRLYRVYARMQMAATGVDRGSRAKLAMILLHNSHHEASIRSDYRDVFAAGVHRWSLMSANYRTLAIFVFAILKVPLYYFWFEVVVLTGIFGVLLSGQHARYTVLFERLQARTAAPR